VDAGQHAQHVPEVQAILGAYGAREFGGPQTVSTTTETGTGAQTGQSAAGVEERREQRIRAEEGARVELVEEELRARTRPVQTGEVTIRREVVSETRTIEVPVRREELVIERHPVERHPMDTAASAPTDPLIQQLLDRLRHMQPGELLRIPIIEEEVVVHKRPVVVEEITLGKRTVQDTQTVSDTVRGEEARIEPHGDVPLHKE
jgi:stress response protein YsnF